jgi:hypothetical protein
VASDASPGPAAGATNGSLLRVFVLRKHGWLPLQDQALPRAGPAYSGGRVEAEKSVRRESLGRCWGPESLGVRRLPRRRLLGGASRRRLREGYWLDGKRYGEVDGGPPLI